MYIESYTYLDRCMELFACMYVFMHLCSYVSMYLCIYVSMFVFVCVCRFSSNKLFHMNMRQKVYIHAQKQCQVYNSCHPMMNFRLVSTSLDIKPRLDKKKTNTVQ